MAAPMNQPQNLRNLEENAVSHVADFINQHFTGETKSLSNVRDVREAYKQRYCELKEQMSLVSHDAPSKIAQTVDEARHTVTSAHSLSISCKSVAERAAEKAAEVLPQIKELRSTKKDVDDLEQYMSYLEWIARIDDLSSSIQTALITESVEQAVSFFSDMTQIAKDLEPSQCAHLVKFVRETVMFWYKILKDNLVKEFEDTLTSLHWPIVNTSSQQMMPANVGELKEKMEVLFCQLVKLQLPDSMATESESHHQLINILPEWRPLLLPIQLMIKPLRKRFRFHFYGNKQTNSLDKTEWYLTQILTWLRDHNAFLTGLVQPMLRKAGLAHIDAQVEFARGLVVLAMEKLVADIPELMYDEHLYSHMIDEVLLFDRELRQGFDYPISQLGCLHILTREDAFEKWLAIEKKFAVEKVDAMLASGTAWQSQYSELTDVDDLRVPEAGEAFLTLVLTITDRYKLLPYPSHRVRFLDLQIELIDDYRIRLSQLMKEENRCPTSRTLCALLNTVYYISDVLREWDELPFFIQLHYYRCLYNQQPENDLLMTSSSTDSPLAAIADNMMMTSLDSLGSSAAADISALTSPILNASSPESTYKVQGGLFEPLVTLFDHLRTDMMKGIVVYVMTDVRARSKPYRKDRWISLPNQKDLSSLGLSASGCEMFLILKEWLQTLQERLGKAMFKTFWENIAEKMNNFIFRDVILENHFNEGGAAQIHYDMTRNLFPLFGQYCKKPEHYFKDVKDALTLLTIKTGTAILLKKLIFESLHTVKMFPNLQDPLRALGEVGVQHLDPDQAELVLSLRTDLT